MNVTSSKNPAVFEEFFELGLEETASPFITDQSRQWGAHLTLKSAILAAILLACSFALSFYPHTLPLSHLLLVMVYFLAGIPSLIESIEDLAAFDINIDILMTLAAFSSVLIGSGMEGGLLLVLFALSGSMEDAVTMKAKGAISSLHKLSPTRALVQTEKGLIERAIKDVDVNQLILIRSGQIVPLDGIVIEGTSSVNLVHLTGENFPLTKTVGDSIPAGARNIEGALLLKVTHTSADSTLSRIIELVTQAQDARPKLQRWFDRLSQGYAITIILFSALFALTLPFLMTIPFFGVEGSLYRALTFLIAASPCALIIAIPIAYLSAVSICARQGILLKGGLILDALSTCKTIAFDKTGTLTTGDLTCESFEPLINTSISANEALSIAYAMEKNAVHPIAKAIIKTATDKQVSSISIKDYKSIPGYGLEAKAFVNHKEEDVFIGKPSYIFDKLPKDLENQLKEKIHTIQKQGKLVAVLLIGQTPFIFCFHDTLRSKMKETIASLKKLGLQLVMLTGDHLESAQRVANELNLTDFKAALSPEDKLKAISLLAQNNNLAMVGDGVNDAPALARANVGICMGKVGSTAAIDAADVVLLHDNIEYLGWLFEKAHQTQRIVKQNLLLATFAMIAASIPALLGAIPLWTAVILHEGGTVLVGLNGLRLLRK